MRTSRLQNLILESLIYIIIVSLIVMLILSYYVRLTDIAKQSVLKAEINNIKIALQVYKFKENTYPDTLKDLIDYKLPRIGKRIYDDRYFVFLEVDDKGYPVDPYGERYIYNKEKGTVESVSFR